jgi:hypothetical protein
MNLLFGVVCTVTSINITVRERPFNLKGGMFFFSKKTFRFPILRKKYSDFGGGKKEI